MTMNELDPIVRSAGLRHVLGDIGKTKQHEMQEAGIIPPPDVWLGPRTPGWFTSTVRRIQASLAAQPRPPEKPRGGGWKRRKAAQAEAAA
jgi:hypothetical protein